MAPTLPGGVHLTELEPHPDERGTFTEVFRAEWDTGIMPVQWNVVRSEARVLRGVHVHIRHSDYLSVIEGRASIGLVDLRRGSPSERRAAMVELSAETPLALTIPPGVAHGFYFHVPSIHLYSVSRYWDLSDELGCHWSDPGLALNWADREPMLSARDAGAGSLEQLLTAVEPHQPFAE